jgi:hypothetical protein
MWYMPTKFEINFAELPLATGVEATLIQAEAALKMNDAGTWAGELIITDYDLRRRCQYHTPTCRVGLGHYEPAVPSCQNCVWALTSLAALFLKPLSETRE